jgi:hypothetical protein
MNYVEKFGSRNFAFLYHFILILYFDVAWDLFIFIAFFKFAE